ncbi:MAG: KpsF/GutQ family sugar-phosphate isomerase [Rhodocyclaceae bacterium]|nr:KpsF/GutQ family sugar-phosphate isomerase [Rhodocyclaceae bacterium]
MNQSRKPHPPAEHILEMARRTLRIEAEAVTALAERLGNGLGQDFVAAVRLILECHGRVIVSGIGKSGHIARKIAATLASTGTPAYFVHAAEAIHGDLGMIARQDIVIAISNSGSSEELLTISAMLKREGGKLIAITGNASSPLARDADVHLDARVAEEACPLQLAPTASTTAALALGDALAVALLDAHDFQAEDFARSHPGGSLGRRLLTHVRDVMRAGERIPTVADTATIADALLEMSRKGMGMTTIVDAANKVTGIYTDGDLRRTLEHETDIKRTLISTVMTAGPRTVGPDKMAAEAIELMERYKTFVLPVVDENGALVGALSMHDLFHARII